jgi:hypothetical protein
VPRLASESDNEVVATVRAIGRTLASSGLDWHDLAAALRATGEAALRSRDSRHLRAAADWCTCHDALLNEREADFIANVQRALHRGRAVAGRPRVWLERLEVALRRRMAEGHA